MVTNPGSDLPLGLLEVLNRIAIDLQARRLTGHANYGTFPYYDYIGTNGSPAGDRVRGYLSRLMLQLTNEAEDVVYSSRVTTSGAIDGLVLAHVPKGHGPESKQAFHFFLGAATMGVFPL